MLDYPHGVQVESKVWQNSHTQIECRTDYDRETLKDIKEVYPQIQRAWALVLSAGGWAGEWRSVRFDSEQLYKWFLMWRTDIIRTDSESESHSTDVWCCLESTHSLLLVLLLFLSIPFLFSLSLALALLFSCIIPVPLFLTLLSTPILWLDTFSLCLSLSLCLIFYFTKTSHTPIKILEFVSLEVVFCFSSGFMLCMIM